MIGAGQALQVTAFVEHQRRGAVAADIVERLQPVLALHHQYGRARDARGGVVADIGEVGHRGREHPGLRPDLSAIELPILFGPIGARRQSLGFARPHDLVHGKTFRISMLHPALFLRRSPVWGWQYRSMGIDPKPLVRYQVAVSIDGFIAPEDGGIEWLEGHAGGDGFEAFLKTIGGIVMGRASFEQNLTFGPWNWEQPTVVMSSRPFAEPLPKGVETCAGEPARALELLRARMTGGDVWLFGGRQDREPVPGEGPDRPVGTGRNPDRAGRRRPAVRRAPATGATSGASNARRRTAVSSCSNTSVPDPKNA